MRREGKRSKRKRRKWNRKKEKKREKERRIIWINVEKHLLVMNVSISLSANLCLCLCLCVCVCECVCLHMYECICICVCMYVPDDWPWLHSKRTLRLIYRLHNLIFRVQHLSFDRLEGNRSWDREIKRGVEGRKKIGWDGIRKHE